MKETSVSITATGRTVWRVKASRAGLRPTFRYFTTTGAAVKFAAWEIVSARYPIYDWSYTVRGIACECHDPESGPGYYSAGWEGCPLHDHRDGYYARLHRKIAARLRREIERPPAPPPPPSLLDMERQVLGSLGDAMEILNVSQMESPNLVEAASLLGRAITQVEWAIRQAEQGGAV